MRKSANALIIFNRNRSKENDLTFLRVKLQFHRLRILYVLCVRQLTHIALLSGTVKLINKNKVENVLSCTNFAENVVLSHAVLFT